MCVISTYGVKLLIICLVHFHNNIVTLIPWKASNIHMTELIDTRGCSQTCEINNNLCHKLVQGKCFINCVN